MVSMRYVFLAVCLSLSADMRYLSAAEINLPDLGDSAGSVISPEQERKIAKSFLRELRRQAPLETDEEIVDYLNELGDALSKNADYEGEFEICLIKSKSINAFAVPGGLICFNSGLILESQSEAIPAWPVVRSALDPEFLAAHAAARQRFVQTWPY